MVKVMRLYNKLVMSSKGEGMKCGMVEVVKHNTPEWFSLKTKCNSVINYHIISGLFNATKKANKLETKSRE